MTGENDGEELKPPAAKKFLAEVDPHRSSLLFGGDNTFLSALDSTQNGEDGEEDRLSQSTASFTATAANSCQKRRLEKIALKKDYQ